ncbi:uncharacterized protein LOC109852160 [Pseudomyrmex gracilis]|uniref:uncharacterized protein LOC109852160 n=1 Tax=Pseudomyrmex gracilis TaxID=219809 RepID=UPI000994AABE|nr:uncharacterized protein LOC109852160 [Pseudomyrmex gracilis]XP_020278638.1 uncharacterized protein LOC109852160 [Pseudomyrmex gracilis]
MCKLVSTAISVICVAAFGLADKLTLPVIVCKRNSPDYSICLKDAAEEAWPRFLKGLPEFDFPSLDPLVYTHGTATFETGEIRGEVTLSNTTAKGLKENRFTNARANLLDNIFRLELDFVVPRILLEGYVTAQGSLGAFRMNGKGPFNLTIDNVEGTYDLTGHVTNDTWVVEHFTTLPSVRKMKIYLEEIFNSKEINDLAISFINEYWPALYRVMLPVAAKEWDKWLTDLSNRLFSKVSFSALFP